MTSLLFVIHTDQVQPPMLDAIFNLASGGVSVYILSTPKREYIQLTSLYLQELLQKFTELANAS
jgi:hypothetical protein